MSTPQAVRTGTTRQPASDAEMEMLHVDDRLQEEMERLAAINQELLARVRPGPQKTLEFPEEPDELTRLCATRAMPSALSR